MKKKANVPAPTDWRAEIKFETRQRNFNSILAKLKEHSTQCHRDAKHFDKITNYVREQETKLFNFSKSKEEYFNGLTKLLKRSENLCQISSNQDHPAFSSDQSVVIIKKEAFESQPRPQMTNQPYQWAVPNQQNQHPAVPYSCLEPNIKQSTSQPHEQLHGQTLNIRPPNQQPVLHNQSYVIPQNTLNSPCQPKLFQGQVFEIQQASESVTHHPKAVKLQPNEDLRSQVKEEVLGKEFHASKFLPQQLSAFEQHKQHQSLGVPAVPNGNPNEVEPHSEALNEVQYLRKYLPFLKSLYAKTSEKLLQTGQIELIQKKEQQKNLLQLIINFLEMPRDTIMSRYNKDRLYGILQLIRNYLKPILEDRSKNHSNKQQPLRGQSSVSQSHINPVQQRDNVNPHFQLVNLATPGSSDNSSPRAPRETGPSRSEAGCPQKYILQKKQHSENIKQEFHPSWIQQTQKSTGNIQASNRSGMCGEYHLNSKFSPQTLEASMLSKIAEQAAPINPSSTTLLGRANSSIPPSSTVGHGKSPANPSNSKCPQGCHSLELHDSNTVIQVQSHEIRNTSTMTCQLADPTNLENNVQLPTKTKTGQLVEPINLGNNVQLSTETNPHDRLLKAVELLSNEALRVVVSELISVGNIEDRISLQDGRGFSNNLKRKINATTLNYMPSPYSVIDGSEPIVTSSYKKLKKLTDHALLEEMRKINNQFIETVLELNTDEDFNRRWANAGIVLRLSYRATNRSINSVLRSSNELIKLPMLSIKLLLPLDYPEHYPVFLSKSVTVCGTDDEELRNMSRNAGLLLCRFLHANPGYLSLEDHAKVWDDCARHVVLDYAKRAGGGCFSSRYGTWEDCVAAT